jgi:hypothetical protein
MENKADEKIYVHGSDIAFNTLIYCFMRAYHLPTLEGQDLPLKDTWFAVPAVKHGPIIHLVNPNIEFTALMMIDSAGHVVKAARVNPNIAPALSEFELAEIQKEMFDIPLWEKTQQESFPYDSMFEKTAVAERFKATGATPATAMNIESSNITYQTIRKKVQPRPCTTCGGKR